MLLVPGVAAVGVLLWRDSPTWMLLVVGGSYVAAWWMMKAYRAVSYDISQGRDQADTTFNAFQWTTNAVIWVYWLICLGAIVASFVL